MPEDVIWDDRTLCLLLEIRFLLELFFDAQLLEAKSSEVFRFLPEDPWTQGSGVEVLVGVDFPKLFIGWDIGYGDFLGEFNGLCHNVFGYEDKEIIWIFLAVNLEMDLIGINLVGRYVENLIYIRVRN